MGKVVVAGGEVAGMAGTRMAGTPVADDSRGAAEEAETKAADVSNGGVEI